jgi:hypothetical protein
MKFKRLLFLLPVFLVLTSGIYRHDQPIEKYLSLANQDRFNCVGEVFKLDGNTWVSGGSFVLIDSMTILSAAHVFVGAHKKDTVVNYQGQKFKTYIERGKYKRRESEFRFRVMNCDMAAQKITFHSQYLLDGTCDVAIIKLEKPIRGVKQLNINFQFDEVSDTVTGVGFGVSGPANNPTYVKSYHLKLAGQNIIDSIGGATINGKNTMLFADFDAPEQRQDCNRIGSAVPLELEYSIGAGDSGGPLFRSINGELCLAGIASFAPKTVENLLKNGYYCELNGWTRVSAFSDWIKNNR